jgi:hypothetical protein
MGNDIKAPSARLSALILEDNCGASPAARSADVNLDDRRDGTGATALFGAANVYIF